jgi:hypothetical protein
MTQHILNQLHDENPDAVLFDNMNGALIGFGAAGYLNPVAIYSKKLMLAQLMRDGLSAEDAEEYFLSKFVGLWAADNTPVILDDTQEE